MNKYILFFFLVLISCGNGSNEVENPNVAITCNLSEITVSQNKTMVSLFITCEREWSIYSNETWIHCELPSKDPLANIIHGDAFVTIDANDGKTERNGIVYIKSGPSQLAVPVTQSIPMQVSKTELYSNSTGEILALTVTAADDWSVKSNDSWIKAIKTDSKTVNITTDPNENKVSRNGTFELTSGAEKITVSVTQESAEDREINTPEGYRLVWHDEFNEGIILGSDWTHEVQKAGWVNNELQNYVNGSADDKRVTELVDGKLRINCFKGSDSKIYSGRVYAHVNEGWKYGYVEARIMLPKGKGTWPAFWMMPVHVDWDTEGWPKCGEIDIMEEVGVVSNEVSSSLHAEGHNHTNGTQVTHAMTIEKAEGEFHIYAMEWTSQNITTYVDGKVLLTYNNDNKGVINWPYDKPYYIILNLAWGGSWGGMQGVDDSALPVSYLIDYVRVFQKK